MNEEGSFEVVGLFQDINCQPKNSELFVSILGSKLLCIEMVT
jgi:hypothetical protein